MNERIKELRKNCGLSQLELATQIGCSQNTISKIEKGDTQPLADILKAICEFFHVSADYLLGLDIQYDSDAYYLKYQMLSTDAKDLVNKLIDLLSTKQK